MLSVVIWFSPAEYSVLPHPCGYREAVYSFVPGWACDTDPSHQSQTFPKYLILQQTRIYLSTVISLQCYKAARRSQAGGCQESDFSARVAKTAGETEAINQKERKAGPRESS